MGIKTGSCSDAQLLDKYVNTSYDKVVNVHDNMASVVNVSNNMSDVNIVADAANNGLLDNLEDFTNIYYGNFANEVALEAAMSGNRPDGSPRQAGDLYFNELVAALYVWDGTLWVSIATYETTRELKDITVATQTVVFDDISYTLGKNSLVVYLNGALQVASPSDAPNTKDYEEVNPSTIFFNEPLEVGDEITAYYGVVRGTTDVNIKTQLDSYTATAGQTLFNLDTEYVTGQYNIYVYVNGVFQVGGTHYTETSSTSITFSEGLDLDDEVTVITGVIANNYSTSLDSKREVFTIANSTTNTISLINYEYIPGSNNLQIFLNGVKQYYGTSYTEDADKVTIHFSDYLVEGDVVECLIGTVITNYPEPRVITKQEVHTATANQTTFNLTNSYYPNTNNISVYLNGVKLLSTDYSEPTTTQIVLATGVNAGDNVQFVIGEVFNGSITAGNVTYNQGSTGAVSTTVQAKLQESVSVLDFGAVGDALYFNTSNNEWYSDSGYTTLATDDTAAIQAAIDAVQATGGSVKLTGRHLIKGTVYLKASVKLYGDVAGQGEKRSAALCAWHGVTSTRQADNTWSNPVLYADHPSYIYGGSELHSFAILANNSSNTLSNQAPRCGLQGYFWMNGAVSNIHVSGFAKAGVSFVGLVQDRHLSSLWIESCGTNTSSEYVAALETRPNTVEVSPHPIGRAPNALHFSGMRMNNNAAFIDIDQGTSNLGEIDFVGCKFEIRDSQEFYDSPFKVGSGAGAIYFGGGSHVTAPKCERSAGDGGAKQWVFDIANYQTRFGDITLRGNAANSVRMLRSTGVWVELDGVTWINALIDNYGMNISAGSVDMVVMHDMANASGGRYGITVGNDVHIKRLSFVSSSNAVADVTSGVLVLVPDGLTGIGDGTFIDNLVIDDDGSGYKIWNRIIDSQSGSAFDDKSGVCLGNLSVPVYTRTSALTSGRIYYKSYGNRIVLDVASAVVASIIEAPIGAEIIIKAGTNGFTLRDNTSISTLTGRDIVVASGETVILKMMAGNLAQQIATPTGSQYYESSELTIGAATGGTVAHGLGVRPSFVGLSLICKTAELNYSIGDEVEIPSLVWYESGTATPRGISVTADDTNIIYKCANATNPIRSADKTTGASSVFTSANWKLILRAKP